MKKNIKRIFTAVHKPQISVFPTHLPNVQNVHSQSNATRPEGSVTGKAEWRETVS